MFKKTARWVFAGILACAAGTSFAFPERNLTIIVPFAAGTINDLGARDIARVLEAVSHHAVVVENRAGAEGTIGTQALLNAAADGHTLMFSSNSITVFDPLMKKNMPYDAARDLIPICGAGRTNILVQASGAGNLKSLSDVVAAAKAQPGKLTFAYTSTSMRMAGEMFQQATGIKLTSVPYKASLTGLTDVSSGLVDLIFIDGVSSAAFNESGKVRPLAAAGDRRTKIRPDLPAAAELGVPGYNVTPWFGLYASAKTPPAVLNQVRELVAQALKTPEMTANLDKRGLDTFNLCGPALVKYMQEETEGWRQVIKKAGIEPQ